MDRIALFFNESLNDIILGVVGFGLNALVINYIIKYRQKRDFEKKWSSVRLIIYADILLKITHFYKPFLKEELFNKSLISIGGTYSKREVLRVLTMQELQMITAPGNLPDDVKGDDLLKLTTLLNELLSLIDRFNFIIDAELVYKILGIKQTLDDYLTGVDEGKLTYFKSLHQLMLVQSYIYFDVNEFKKYNQFLKSNY